MPTAAGYLIDSCGAQAFVALVFGCTFANLCLFKPVLLYGRRVQQALLLVKAGANYSDTERETQSMIEQPDAHQDE